MAAERQDVPAEMEVAENTLTRGIEIAINVVLLPHRPAAAVRVMNGTMIGVDVAADRDQGNGAMVGETATEETVTILGMRIRAAAGTSTRNATIGTLENGARNDRLTDIGTESTDEPMGGHQIHFDFTTSKSRSFRPRHPHLHHTHVAQNMSNYLRHRPST